MSKQYLFRVKIFSKKNSHPLETISFYSGQDQFDMSEGKKFTSNSKDNVVWNNIEIPSKKNNPEKFMELPEYLKFRSETPKKDMIQNARNILWQQVASREKRDDAQLSRMFEVAIPSFLSIAEAVETIRDFSKVLINEGMIADCSLHARQNSLNISMVDRIRLLQSGEAQQEKGENISNMYQGFIVCPLRSYKEGDFNNKERTWNQTFKLEEWRYKWVEILTDVTMRAKISDEERQSWEEKMSIYEEYKEIKETWLKKSVSNASETSQNVQDKPKFKF